jgi:hypothetical protein
MFGMLAGRHHHAYPKLLAIGDEVFHAVPTNIIQRFLSPYASRHVSQGVTCHMRDTRGFS